MAGAELALENAQAEQEPWGRPCRRGLSPLSFPWLSPTAFQDWEMRCKDCPDRFLDLKGWPADAVIITRVE